MFIKHLKPKLSALLIILLALSLFFSACGGGRGAEPGQSLNSQSNALENSSSDLESQGTLESDESSEEALDDGGLGKPSESQGEKAEISASQNPKESASSASSGKPTTTKRVNTTKPAKTTKPTTTKPPQTKASPTAKETTTAKTTPTPPGGKLLGKLHLYIDAKNALPHIKGKVGYDHIPSSGVVLDIEADLYEGDSVADILTRELDSRSIPHKLTQGNNYIKSLAGLAEKDCGPYSGWYYYVNGASPPIGVGKYNQSMKPNPGIDLYPLKAGDKIAFYYTVNQRDVPGRQ